MEDKVLVLENLSEFCKWPNFSQDALCSNLLLQRNGDKTSVLNPAFQLRKTMDFPETINIFFVSSWYQP